MGLAAWVAASGCGSTWSALFAPAWRAPSCASNVRVADATGAAAWALYEARRSAWVTELAESVLPAVGRRDTDHAVFHGCIDWHSAVHGHFALLAAYRVTGYERYRRAVDESLTPQGIAAEAAYLRREPRFELPYGRAWLLRLAVEWERNAGDDRLRAVAGEAAQSLRAYYASGGAGPESREYDNASWALRQLHDWCSTTRDEGCLGFVARLVDSSFAGAGGDVRLERDRVEWPDFFSPWGNWAHLLGATLTPERFGVWIAAHRPGEGELRPVSTLRTAHHLGVDFSRAWGLWTVYERLGEERYRDAAAEHLAAGMGVHAACKADYGAYGHWVPQFGIYAMSGTR
jgi:hypothetical protein